MLSYNINHHVVCSLHTVPNFNSCTKCVGSPGRIHDRTPECSPIFLGMDVYMTSQLILALIRKLRVSSMYLDYFLTCYTRCLYNQALPDVRSTGAGIKYLFCTFWYSWIVNAYASSPVYSGLFWWYRPDQADTCEWLRQTWVWQTQLVSPTLSSHTYICIAKISRETDCKI